MSRRSDLKPIETSYKGYHFRSRLEARWAVFLDVVKIPWRYESEGFDLGGEWYLPDFFLPDHRIWVEIKPESPTAREYRLAWKLSEATGQAAIILAGQPWPHEYNAHCCHWNQNDVGCDEGFTGLIFGRSDVVGTSELCRCHECDGLWIAEGDLGPGPSHDDWPSMYRLLLRGWYKIGRHACGQDRGDPIPFDERSPFAPAFAEARAARFDHQHHDKE